MAYFKGKLVGILGDIEFENQTHSRAIEAASKLFEAQGACFVKAYRD